MSELTKQLAIEALKLPGESINLESMTSELRGVRETVLVNAPHQRQSPTVQFVALYLLSGENRGLLLSDEQMNQFNYLVNIAYAQWRQLGRRSQAQQNLSREVMRYAR